jgi:Homeodomain-like domain
LRQKGKSRARQLVRARILLQAEEGFPDEESAPALDVGIATVERLRQRCVAMNLAALNDRPRPGGQCPLTGTPEAYLMAVACTPAPPGPGRWTVQWVAERVVALGGAPSMARETVRQVLKKTRSTPGRTSRGVCRR